MKSILISIKPEFVEKILNGEKTIEIRKTKPSCELPCKVYIYETKSKYKKGFYNNLDHKVHYCEYFGKGNVVAEFTLNKVSTYDWDTDFLNTKQNMYYIKSGEVDKTCLTYEQMCDYGKGKDLYGWYIDNLKIFERPKELSEFYKNNYKKIIDDLEFNGCDEKHCKYAIGNSFIGDDGYCDYSGCPKLRLQIPPQSWCYVEELEV